MSKGLRIALIVSLALNCVFLGVGLTVLGYHFFGVPKRDFMFVAGPGHGVMGPGGGMGPMPGMIMGALDPETRKKVSEILNANRAEMRATFEGVIEARRNTHKVLTTEPYSADALEAAFAKSREADMKALEEGHKVAVKVISALTPEERAKVAKAISEGGPKFFHKRLHHRWGKGGFGFMSKDWEQDEAPDFAVPPPPPGEESPPPPPAETPPPPASPQP
jgi:uncharacterized membrane protein